MKTRLKKFTALLCSIIMLASVVMLAACKGKKDDPVYYTVTFDGNGGTYVSGDTTQSVEKGKGATAPVFTKSGYALSWDKDFSNITADTAVKAVWTSSASGGQTDAEILEAACAATMALTDYKVNYNLIDGSDRFDDIVVFDVRNYGKTGMYFSGGVDLGVLSGAGSPGFFNVFLYDSGVLYFDNPDGGKIKYDNIEGVDGVFTLNAAVYCIEDNAGLFIMAEFFNRSVLGAEFMNSMLGIGYSDFTRAGNNYICEGPDGELITVTVSNGAVVKLTVDITSEGLQFEIIYSQPTGAKRTAEGDYDDYKPEEALEIIYDDFNGFYYVSGVNGLILGAVTIPDTYDDGINGKENVTLINNSAFENCSGLTSVTIGANVQYIYGSAFQNCKGLTSVIIPDSVTYIGSNAFGYCIGLTSVTIGANVQSIGYEVFYRCTRLKNIIVDENNNSYSVEDGVLYNKDKTELLICPAGKTGAFTIPGSVTKIGYGAFEYCEGLTSVTIGANVDYIYSYAFYKCTGLTSVIIPDSVTCIDYSAFEDCSGLTSVTIGANVETIGEGAFNWCTKLKNIIVDENNDYFSAADGVLYNKDKTKLLICSAGKTGAFTISGSVTEIGGRAFYVCTGLTSVIIPDSVTKIGYSAFVYCEGLTSVTIGANVQYIGKDAFYRCTKLKNIIVDESNDYFSAADGVLYNKDKTELLVCPAGKTGEFIVPNSVTKIGYGAFQCAGLISVTMGPNVQYISSDAFYGCTKLKTVYVERSITDGGITEILGSGVFYSCKALEAIYVPADSLAEYQEAWSQYSRIIYPRS